MLNLAAVAVRTFIRSRSRVAAGIEVLATTRSWMESGIEDWRDWRNNGLTVDEATQAVAIGLTATVTRELAAMGVDQGVAGTLIQHHWTTEDIAAWVQAGRSPLDAVSWASSDFDRVAASRWFADFSPIEARSWSQITSIDSPENAKEARDLGWTPNQYERQRQESQERDQEDEDLRAYSENIEADSESYRFSVIHWQESQRWQSEIDRRTAFAQALCEPVAAHGLDVDNLVAAIPVGFLGAPEPVGARACPTQESVPSVSFEHSTSSPRIYLGLGPQSVTLEAIALVMSVDPEEALALCRSSEILLDSLAAPLAPPDAKAAAYSIFRERLRSGPPIFGTVLGSGVRGNVDTRFTSQNSTVDAPRSDRPDPEWLDWDTSTRKNSVLFPEFGWNKLVSLGDTNSRFGLLDGRTWRDLAMGSLIQLRLVEVSVLGPKHDRWELDGEYAKLDLHDMTVASTQTMLPIWFNELLSSGVEVVDIVHGSKDINDADLPMPESPNEERGKIKAFVRSILNPNGDDYQQSIRDCISESDSFPLEFNDGVTRFTLRTPNVTRVQPCVLTQCKPDFHSSRSRGFSLKSATPAVQPSAGFKSLVTHGGEHSAIGQSQINMGPAWHLRDGFRIATSKWWPPVIELARQQIVGGGLASEEILARALTLAAIDQLRSSGLDGFLTGDLGNGFTVLVSDFDQIRSTKLTSLIQPTLNDEGMRTTQHLVVFGSIDEIEFVESRSAPPTPEDSTHVDPRVAHEGGRLFASRLRYEYSDVEIQQIRRARPGIPENLQIDLERALLDHAQLNPETHVTPSALQAARDGFWSELSGS